MVDPVAGFLKVHRELKGENPEIHPANIGHKICYVHDFVNKHLESIEIAWEPGQFIFSIHVSNENRWFFDIGPTVVLKRKL